MLPKATTSITSRAPVQGIYAIVHTESGHAYVGSSKDIHGRWKGHQGDLRRNDHQSRLLQDAWNAYGADAFEWHILEIVADASMLITKEQEWMDRLSALITGFNVHDAGTGRVRYGRKHTTAGKPATPTQMEGLRQGHGPNRVITEDMRRRWSIGNGNRKLTEETVRAIRRDGPTAPSLTALAERYGTSRQIVSGILKGKMHRYTT